MDQAHLHTFGREAFTAKLVKVQLYQNREQDARHAGNASCHIWSAMVAVCEACAG